MITLLIEPGQPPQLVNVSWEEIRRILGWLEIIHPFEDPNVVLIDDEDGIRNERLPNRTINGCIIPGPFFICRFDAAEEFVDLTPADIKLYSDMFSVPEHFAKDGQWRITSYTEEIPEKHLNIFHMESAWVPSATSTTGKETSS